MGAIASRSHPTTTPLGLPPSWFWDVELETIDPEKDARMIIDGVLVAGTLEGWLTIRQYDGDDRLRSVVTGLRSTSPQNVALLCLVLGLKKKDFRCGTAKPFPQAAWPH